MLTVPDDERAFYSKGTYDIEYDFPFGRQELEGVAYRTDYDLSQHQKASGKSLEYFDEETKQRFIPHVVEPSAGVDRTVLALICEAYSEDQAPDEKGKMETRSAPFYPRIAPIKKTFDGVSGRRTRVHWPLPLSQPLRDFEEGVSAAKAERRTFRSSKPRQSDEGSRTWPSGEVTVCERRGSTTVRIKRRRVLYRARPPVASSRHRPCCPTSRAFFSGRVLAWRTSRSKGLATSVIVGVVCDCCVRATPSLFCAAKPVPTRRGRRGTGPTG